MIILNFEDDFEFMLTMYLRSIYKNNSIFLDSLVNIIHNSINYKLLYSKNRKNSIILSEKIVGEFMTQATFNNKIVPIFEELTHSCGNEFYILTKENYNELFLLSIEELKLQLFYNDMIYIGAISSGEFVVNYTNMSKIDKIVVLAQGI